VHVLIADGQRSNVTNKRPLAILAKYLHSFTWEVFAIPPGWKAGLFVWLVEGAGPGHLNASNEPERVALVRRRAGTPRLAGTA
jgi:hypothetical protein